jgi:hypothetical protein
MIILLRCVFIGILVAMLAVTTWASGHIALWKMPREVVTHPWFIATLFDAYFGFLIFWMWLAWLEHSWARSIAWLAAILVLGNIAMAVYMLRRLFRLPATASMADVVSLRL